MLRVTQNSTKLNYLPESTVQLVFKIQDKNIFIRKIWIDLLSYDYPMSQEKNDKAGHSKWYSTNSWNAWLWNKIGKVLILCIKETWVVLPVFT